jgi:hypothetical protein
MLHVRAHHCLACALADVQILSQYKINHLDSHMYHVLYFGVLIRSSFGEVTSVTNIHTESQVLAFANKVPDL